MSVRRRAASLPLLLTLLALAPLSGGCALVRQLVAGEVRAPSITFVRATPQGVTLAGLTLTVVLRVHNPNELPLICTGARYALEIEGRTPAFGRLERTVEIPARGEGEVTLPVELRFAELGAVVERLRTSRTLRYRAFGAVLLQTPLGARELPFSHEAELPLPALPTVTLRGLSLAKAGGGKVALQLALRLENPNDVPLPLGGLAGALSLDGAALASIASPGGELPAHGALEVTVPLEVELAKAGRLAKRLLVGGDARLSLDGTLEVGGILVPLEAASSRPLERR